MTVLFLEINSQSYSYSNSVTLISVLVDVKKNFVSRFSAVQLFSVLNEIMSLSTMFLIYLIK